MPARAVIFMLALGQAAATVYTCDGTAQALQGEYAGVEFDFDQPFVLQMDINMDASQDGNGGIRLLYTSPSPRDRG